MRFPKGEKVRGERRNEKCQMTNGKVQMEKSLDSGKTSSERDTVSGPVVARVPRRNVKEFWLTILREAERLQILLSEPEGRVLDLQWSEL